MELNTDDWRGRVHQRKMVNRQYEIPIWGPGHFNITNSSYIDFELCKPLATRPNQLDAHLVLERADKLLGHHQWGKAVDLLYNLKDIPLARPSLVKALSELGDPYRTIAILWPPLSIAETVVVGGAILDRGTREEAEAFNQLEIVSGNNDASIRDISRRIRERWLR